MEYNAFEILIEGRLQSSSLWQYVQDTRPQRKNKCEENNWWGWKKKAVERLWDTDCSEFKKTKAELFGYHGLCRCSVLLSRKPSNPTILCTHPISQTVTQRPWTITVKISPFIIQWWDLQLCYLWILCCVT